jgi:hypothetical protein
MALAQEDNLSHYIFALQAFLLLIIRVNKLKLSAYLGASETLLPAFATISSIKMS